MFKIDRLQADIPNQDSLVNESRMMNVNTKTTSFGRPLNLTNAQKRWRSLIPAPKQVEEYDNESTQQINATNFDEIDESRQFLLFPDISPSEAPVKPKPGPQFKVTGSSMLARSTNGFLLNQGRPIPTVQVIENPVSFASLN